MKKIYYYDKKKKKGILYLIDSYGIWTPTIFIPVKSIRNRMTETRMRLSKDNKEKQKAFENFKGYVKWEKWADYKCR